MDEIKLVIFDLAGTIIDDTDEIPLKAFIEAFSDCEIEVSRKEANAKMGMSKIDSIKEILRSKYGYLDEDLAQRVYEKFPARLEVRLQKNTKPIEGTEEIFKRLKRQEIRIATTTGYYRKAEQIVLSQVKWIEKGLLAAHVCDSDVSKGRPSPDMIFKAMELTGIKNKEKVLKVGDTIFDIKAGHNAGVKTVAVLTGAGTREKFEKMEKQPTFIIESINQLPL